MDTPEFLVWAIDYTCPIRGFQNGSDPERTERQLRAARAVSDAGREGRVFEGLCIRPPDAFRIDDALAVFGGLAAVEKNCGPCPANVLAGVDQTILAGCYGTVIVPFRCESFHAAIDTAVRNVACEQRDLFLATKPAWYGLWIASPLAAKQADAPKTIL